MNINFTDIIVAVIGACGLVLEAFVLRSKKGSGATMKQAGSGNTQMHDTINYYINAPNATNVNVNTSGDSAPEAKSQSKRWSPPPAIGAIMIVIALFYFLFRLVPFFSPQPTISNEMAQPTDTNNAIMEHTHHWSDPTCTEQSICSECGAIGSPALGHQWVDATISSPKICSICGQTEGTAIHTKAMIEAGTYHSVYLDSEGYVYAYGKNDPSIKEGADHGLRCDVSFWEDIIAVSASSHTVGVKSDGTVIATGVNAYGQCDLDWDDKDIIAVSAGDEHTLGLCRDGSVVAAGNNYLGKGNTTGRCDVSGWKNIIQIAAGSHNSYGLTKNNRVVVVGFTGNNQDKAKEWTDIIAISAGNDFVVGVTKDYKVITAGLSKKWKDQSYTEWEDIVAVAAGAEHIVALDKYGNVFACGPNAEDQRKVSEWKDVIAISAGVYHTLGMKDDGTILAVGNNDEDQLNITYLNKTNN